MIEIRGETASLLYEEALQQMRVSGRLEGSRNGQVITIREPVLLTLENPMMRVIDDPIRRANPFFHMMEFIWMMAGRCDSGWISQFNKQMESYSDDGVIHAAYGYRWRENFNGIDQVAKVIERLTSDKNTRQAVLAMWDPVDDLDCDYKDKACNTHIYFRYVDGALNMTVCNRSNDLIWGALGANICHMTMLHELIAWAVELPLGRYQVFTNNLHVYTNMPRYIEHFNQRKVEDVYLHTQAQTMFYPQDKWSIWLEDCERFCMGHFMQMTSPWLCGTALAAYRAWFALKENRVLDADFNIKMILQPDWRIACQNWMVRRGETLSSST